jgi:hypothetical protein
MSEDEKETSSDRGPTGHERMRRRAPHIRYGHRRGAIDVKGQFSDVQLREIGAILLEWNELEELSGVLFAASLDLSGATAIRVTQGIAGLEARFSIIRTAVKELELPSELTKLCNASMSELSEYKKIRDLIAHCRMWNATLGIAYSQDYNGRTWEVLVTHEALSRFYQRVGALKLELTSIVGIFIAVSPRTERFVLSEYLTGTVVPEEQWRRSAIRECAAELLDRQRTRKSIPLLPLFPDAPAIRQARAVKQQNRPK